jgi:hypothetical protein
MAASFVAPVAHINHQFHRLVLNWNPAGSFRAGKPVLLGAERSVSLNDWVLRWIHDLQRI